MVSVAGCRLAAAGPSFGHGGSKGVIASPCETAVAGIAPGGIHKRAVFAGFRHPTGRASMGPLRVRYLSLSEAEGESLVNVAYAIGRQFGSAVARNRARRRLRSAVRLVAAEAPPGYSCEPEVSRLGFPQLVVAMRSVMTAAGRGAPDVPGSSESNGTGGAP
jgi:RNase P protein component